jgi:Zn-dependent protease with chaperone function
MKPLNFPPDFTKPSKHFRNQIVLASLAIILFIFLYFGLAFWFLSKAYISFADLFSGGTDGVFNVLVALLSIFLGVFMLKSIFFLNKGGKTDDFEITKSDEPVLFEFIYKLADEIKAPRPHKIYLSNRVNAGVFYDISFINLLFPTKKNLEIGLGLVNSLNLGEFKSILAHEFGHFTQKSMIVGRWVYIAHQVVYQIVNKRDGFDKFLNTISRIDIRIAWIGWILSLIVWSIRSLVEIFFKMVIFTQRALSREMEFHADLVAVSLTGSDAIINSLYKLAAADEAFDDTIKFSDKLLADNKKVPDIFMLQANFIEQMRIVLNNPDYGKSPLPIPNSGSKKIVFKEQMAQSPKMWDTHPSNTDREKNAKKVYIVGSIDERSSWILFNNPQKTKEILTSILFKNIKTETLLISREESIEIHNKEFERSFLSPHYCGLYHSRFILTSIKSVADLYKDTVGLNNLSEKFTELYPPELKEQLQHLKNLEEEYFLLNGLINKELIANEGKLVYKGRELSKEDLPNVERIAKKDLDYELDKINQHLKYCRNLHYQVSKTIDGGWKAYLESITMLLHYCEHTQKNIEVLAKYLYDSLNEFNTYSKADSTDILYLCRIGNELHSALKSVFIYGVTIKLNDQIISRLKGKDFSQLIEPFLLEEAASFNISSWVNVVGSWVNVANNALNELRLAALDELLYTESKIQEISCSNSYILEKAPDPIGIQDTYPKYDPQIKREVIKRATFYSKFQNAEGIVPAISKYAAAFLIVFFAVFFASFTGSSKVVIYNGLQQDLMVYIDGDGKLVEKGTPLEINIDKTAELNIKTMTLEGDVVESFKQKLEKHSCTYVYNISNSAFIYTYKIYYGYSNPGDDYELIGPKRWIEIEADDYFVSPPESMSVHNGQTITRLVVDAHKVNPEELVSLTKDENDRNNLIKSHAIWDSPSSPDILVWLALLKNHNNSNDIIQKRLKIYPIDVVALRSQQDLAGKQEKKIVCENQRKLFEKTPENPDLYYLNCRCFENEQKQKAAFIEGHNKWPGNPWLAYASGYSYLQDEKWDDALSCFDTACKYQPSLKAQLTLEMKRLYQLLGKSNSLESFNLDSPYLTFIRNIENSTEANKETNYFAFKLIASGSLIKAINFVENDTNMNGYIVLLAAASEGASKYIIDKAIAMEKFNYINSFTIFPAMAIAIKNNLPIDKYKRTLTDAYGNYTDSIFKFIDLVKKNKIIEAYKLTNIGNLEVKGKMCLLGVLLLNKNAPSKWRYYADKLLFINEKPYFSKQSIMKES